MIEESTPETAPKEFAAVRKVALELLCATEQGKRFIDELLAERIGGFDPRDRRLLQEISYGALRHQNTLDRLLKAYLKLAMDRQAAAVRWAEYVLGEYAVASIDVPEASSLLADGQSGFYLQGNARFGQGWIGTLPDSEFTAVARWGSVDFDTDIDGDSQDRLTLGLNLRPIEDAVFKIDYQRNWARDRFDNEVESAALLFSVATYF